MLKCGVNIAFQFFCAKNKSVDEYKKHENIPYLKGIPYMKTKDII